ncbi:MAG: dihydropteroate synthase [Deltaproteobacteria bacterium]|nr:dihydropteroate synthase [Deltaproteobacteria bacterium]
MTLPRSLPPGWAPPAIRLRGGRVLSFERALLMGVVNVTPDSFSDGGRYLDPERAVAHGLRLVSEGADLLDVGGESTRPGSEPVDDATQMARVVPVLRALARATEVPLSVDTTSAAVAEAAIEAGATIVNDISAFRFDPQMLPLLARSEAAAIAMHTLGRPATMQRDPRYDDVVAEVAAHLAERLSACAAAGVAVERVLVDPGIGFGKTAEHNLQLIAGLERLASLGRPVVIGTSRKRFLGELTGRGADERDAATAASSAIAVALGAHVVRVHDVAGCRDAARVADAVARARGGLDGRWRDGHSSEPEAPATGESPRQPRRSFDEG